MWFGGGPCPPLLSLGGHGYMKPLINTSLGVLLEYYSTSFLLYQLVLLLYGYFTWRQGMGQSPSLILFRFVSRQVSSGHNSSYSRVVQASEYFWSHLQVPWTSPRMCLPSTFQAASRLRGALTRVYFKSSILIFWVLNPNLGFGKRIQNIVAYSEFISELFWWLIWINRSEIGKPLFSG